MADSPNRIISNVVGGLYASTWQPVQDDADPANRKDTVRRVAGSASSWTDCQVDA